MDYGAIDTLGSVFSAYLDDFRYWHTFHFVFRYFTLDTFMLSIIPEPDHHLLLSYTSYRDTWPHPFSIRRRRGSVLDHFGYAFLHLSDFRFDIFHDGRAWQIVDLLVMMFSLWQLACWVLICLLFAFFSTDHYCCYSSVSFVLSAWCHDTWSCLALPIWGWTFSLHDDWAYFRV